MDETIAIYDGIAADGFSVRTLQMIDNLTNDILYGRKDFVGFTLSEHAGLCKGGAPLIGATIVVGYARRSLTTSGNAESSQGGYPTNWQLALEDMHPANMFIDELTGKPTCIDCIVKFLTVK